MIALTSFGCSLTRGAKRSIEKEPQSRGRPLRRLGRNERLFLGGLRIYGEKLLQQRVGVETDRLRVGAYVGTTEDALRLPREVIGFEPFEQRGLDLGFRRNVIERDLSLLTLLAKPRTKTRFHYNNLVRIIRVVRSFPSFDRSFVRSFGPLMAHVLRTLRRCRTENAPNNPKDPNDSNEF